MPDVLARAAAGAAAQRAFDAKTKPRGSLGRLEALAARVAALEAVAIPARPEAAIVVAAADHGVAAEGVSAYPAEVTAQMVANFVAGGAAINVLAREAGARLVVVDAGVATACAGVRDLRLGAGTASIARGPAMPRETAERGLEAGVALRPSSSPTAPAWSASARWGSATRPRRAPSAPRCSRPRRPPCAGAGPASTTPGSRGRSRSSRGRWR
jgi:nicotinate-nucleotide--dimethylbenzimidazole phosphoribosyltransferase